MHCDLVILYVNPIALRADISINQIVNQLNVLYYAVVVIRCGKYISEQAIVTFVGDFCWCCRLYLLLVRKYHS